MPMFECENHSKLKSEKKCNLAQRARKFKKAQFKKLVKSNESISRIFFSFYILKWKFNGKIDLFDLARFLWPDLFKIFLPFVKFLLLYFLNIFMVSEWSSECVGIWTSQKCDIMFYKCINSVYVLYIIFETFYICQTQWARQFR